MRSWIVQGNDQQTGLSISVLVEAETDAEAANEAIKKGMLVVSVHETPIDTPAINPPEFPPKLSDSEALRRISERLGELLNYARPIRFWVTVIGVLMLLSAILSILIFIVSRL